VHFPPKNYFRKDDALPAESKLPTNGFRIEFGDTPIITADTPAAKYYAEAYLVSAAASEKPPARGDVVVDWPTIEHRGFMLDVSRNRVPTMKWLKWLIDCLALLRYNELQLYTEHTFAYAEHKTVWKNASPFTSEEIQTLDQYCSERHIELVPNQNTFGHMERWLRHPEYKHLAESPDGFLHPISGPRPFGSTLYPCRESLDFIGSLLEELSPNFSSKQIHIGGDEPWELGQGRSKTAVAERGKHAVYLEYVNKVCAHALAYDKIPQLWADVIMERPDLVGELPPNLIPVIWGYEADSPFDTQAGIVAKAGYTNQFYLAPGAGTWNSFGGRLDVARANIQNAVHAARKHGASGLLLTAWGDNGHHQSYATLFPPLILQAQAAWGIPLSEKDELAQEIDAVFFPDSASPQGSILCALGEIDALLPQPAPPNSFLNSALFASSEKLETLCHSISAEDCLSILEKLEALSTQQLDSQTKLALNLNRFAAERCLAHFNHIPFSSASVPETILEAFKSVWLKDSRPGGLDESLDYFAALPN
jgi:hypothetical protein